jgi:glutathione synthase/RimK-type ligase-like ATP-grasp enzyme
METDLQGAAPMSHSQRPLTIAIQPDHVVQPNGVEQSYSDRWLALAAERGVHARVVNAWEPDIFTQLAGCDGFMWRFGYRPPERLVAMRVLASIEHALGLPVFPSWKSAWHFEDKISQYYLLQAAGVPMPRTWVFWHEDAALEFVRRASYPLVIKLANGYRSGNVRLLKDREDAEYWTRQLFGPGVWSFGPRPDDAPFRRVLRRAKASARALAGAASPLPSLRDQLQRGYLYVQEFLPGNEFDTRITVIGNRAFGYRRLNRPGDFRASGSGRPDWDASQIDLEMVRLAFLAARRLGTQSVAVDAMRRGDDRVLGEVSYTYVSWMVRDCPGHWTLDGDPDSGDLRWVEGHMAPDDAIFDDFVAAVRARADRRPLLATA